MNTDAPQADMSLRVLEIQAKLHRWAGDDPHRRFDDLFNIVADSATLREAWNRVRGNTGARSAGVDRTSVRDIEEGRGAPAFLHEIRSELKAGAYRPMPVRERMIPKPGTNRRRRLGIPTVKDRVVQAALKVVLEPIFESDFRSCSYGFRPNRRAQDAIAEIHLFGSRTYEWVLDADIEACFDTISHSALMDRVRKRVGDKRVLRLVKAFLKSGILTELGNEEATTAGTPQGGILSPLLANIALSALDDAFGEDWERLMGAASKRKYRRRIGKANWRLIRYADDFVIMVAGTQDDAESLRRSVVGVLAPMGLRLSESKTQVVHLDDGFDFLGFRIQRCRKRGTRRYHVYTYPSKKSVDRLKAKIRAVTHNPGTPLGAVLSRANSILAGWCNYFRHGVSKRVFSYLGAFSWRRVVNWLRRKHKGLTWKELRRRFCQDRWNVSWLGITLYEPAKVKVSRYRYRGANIPTPWVHRYTA
ncbi:group II intron reverse transcriptase/maturase [Actinomadura meridiana]|uniref:group II intron reverse transcriptase/maturase n=1 Tax=Actinomadura meridiana TaxID=559626 RepID=UPI0031E502BA